MHVFLDFEASGLHSTSFPTEVAWVSADLSAGYTACIAPAPGWTLEHWDLNAQAIHGLELALLQQHGEPVTEVAAALNEALAGADIMTDSPGMDGFWNRQLFAAAGTDCAFPTAPLALVWTFSKTGSSSGKKGHHGGCKRHL